MESSQKTLAAQEPRFETHVIIKFGICIYSSFISFAFPEVRPNIVAAAEHHGNNTNRAKEPK